MIINNLQLITRCKALCRNFNINSTDELDFISQQSQTIRKWLLSGVGPSYAICNDEDVEEALKELELHSNCLNIEEGIEFLESCYNL